MDRRYVPVLKLRTWLFVLALVAMLPVSMFATRATVEFGQSMQTAILDNLQYRTRALRSALQQRVDVAAAEIGSLSDSHSAQAGDWPKLHSHAERMVARNPLLTAITLIDTSSMQSVFITGQAFDAPKFATDATESVRKVMKSGRPHVSGTFDAAQGEDKLVAVTVPLRQTGDTGPIRHVLRAILRVDMLNQVLMDAKMPKGWVAAVVDTNNVFVARSMSPEKFVGKAGSKSFYEGMALTDGQPYLCITVEGTRCTCSVMPIHGGDWFLGLGVPNTVLNEALIRAQRQLAWLALFGLVLAFGMSYICTHFLLKQVKRLLQQVTTHPTQAADLDHQDLHIPELRRLSLGFQRVKSRETEAKHQLHETRLERDEVTDLYELAPCGYHSLDGEGRLVRVNQTLLQWLGYARGAVLGRPMVDFLSVDSREKFSQSLQLLRQKGALENLELEFIRADGRVLPVLLSATALLDAAGQLVSSRATTFDLSERKRWESQLQELARTDALTGLSNRRDFYEKAALEVQRCRRHQQSLAVVSWDIDFFKQVNDGHGHAAGDQVLRVVARACKAELRTIDGIGRLGGEEFAAFLPGATLEGALAVAERLRERVAALRIEVADDQTCQITMSLGLAMWREGDATIDAVLARADEALYAAKNAGRNQVVSRV